MGEYHLNRHRHEPIGQQYCSISMLKPLRNIGPAVAGTNWPMGIDDSWKSIPSSGA